MRGHAGDCGPGPGGEGSPPPRGGAAQAADSPVPQPDAGPLAEEGLADRRWEPTRPEAPGAGAARLGSDGLPPPCLTTQEDFDSEQLSVLASCLQELFKAHFRGEVLPEEVTEE